MRYARMEFEGPMVKIEGGAGVGVATFSVSGRDFTVPVFGEEVERLIIDAFGHPLAPPRFRVTIEIERLP